MTTTQHTPGPWRIVTDGISHWIEIEPNRISLVRANEADRHLIAAAPELLDALKQLLEYDNLGAYERSAARSAARAAIAKATGQPAP